MIRENKYMVLKHSDIALLESEDFVALKEIELMLHRLRELHGKTPLTCVVIESDWPEYESVWNMIEKRMDASSNKGKK